MTDLPLFSPIPWASASNRHERYPSPSLDATAAAVIYRANRANGRDIDAHDLNGTEVSSFEGSLAQMSRSIPPPIDAADIGIVPESVARAAQEGVPLPRGPQNVNTSVEDIETNGSIPMNIE